MTKGLNDTAAPLGVIGAALLCLPCLLPALAVLVGFGAFSAFGGWFSDNVIIAALGAAGALAAAVLAAYAFWMRRQRGAACDPADAQAAIVIESRRVHE